MTTQTNRNRNRTPYRARARGGGQWRPEYLGLYALYDYRNSTSTTMVDQSGNGRADATVGGGSNSPLWLPYTVPQIYFPGSAGNTVSCTAPANTASYSAQPVGGGAPTTGAASAGAFAFGESNAGAWESVSLLDGSAIELARFQASSSTRTGHTDAYSVAWTVNRSASGRKTVVQSPAANSGTGLFLFGTDDWIVLPLAATPPMTASDASTILFVMRAHANPAAGFGRYFSNNSGAGNGRIELLDGSGGSASLSAQFVDTAANVGTTAARAWTAGTRATYAVTINGTVANGLQLSLNGGAAATVTSPAGDRTSVNPIYVGRSGNSAAAFVDMEFQAIATADRVLTAAEIAQAVTFYGGGL